MSKTSIRRPIAKLQAREGWDKSLPSVRVMPHTAASQAAEIVHGPTAETHATPPPTPAILPSIRTPHTTRSGWW